MHELSIAQSIVDIVGQYVPPEQGAEVRTVNVRVGALAGIVPESLAFCFTAITAGTPLAHAALAVDFIPYRVCCAACRTTSLAEPGLALCPHCASAETTVLSGTELQVVDIEMHSDAPEQL
jgi:hydrogenase nickel incorporation protein HypA/HybF